MRMSSILTTFLVVLTAILITSDLSAQVLEAQNRRCKTQEDADASGAVPFINCPWITGSNEVSVSDFSFTTMIGIDAEPTIGERWTGPSYFKEKTYTFLFDQNDNGYIKDGYWMPCAGRSFQLCVYQDGQTYYGEHFDGLVSTLTAENVGTWVYEELRNGVVYERKTFEVKELVITPLSGESQKGIVGQPLGEPLVLKLESFDGDGISGEVIGWSISGPNGAKNAAVYGIGSGSETNSEGIDEATIHLGTKPGVYTVTLNNQLITPQSNPSFTFTAIDDILDTNPVMEHPLLEEAIGKNAQQCDSVGNPIGVSAGNKFQMETDLPRVGISPIEFVRYHNSKGFVSRSFVNYWTHTYDRYIEIPTDPLTETVKVVRPDGKKINFNWNGSAFVPSAGVHSVLNQTAGGWDFSDEDLTLEQFDTDGFLIDITDIDGHVQTATYNGADQLVRIESNSGSSIDLTYDGEGRLFTVTDQSNRTWTYLYDILGRLQYVENPDNTSREYHYENLNHAYALTGVSTENGSRYSYFEYDENGNAITSYHAGGADRVDIHYNANGERIVLDPLDNATVYQTRIENKRAVLDSISGPICSQGCGLTDTQYTYDANYNVISKISYGIQTIYGDYDSKGQPGYMIEAVGTADEKRTDYEYDTRFFGKITSITEPSVYTGEDRVTTRAYDSQGNLLSETVSGFEPSGQAVSRTITHEYNGPFGQISLTDGPRTDVNDVTVYEYYPNTVSEGNNRARLRAVIDPLGNRVRDNISYSSSGKIVSENRLNDVAISYTYFSGSDRVASITESGGGLFNRTQWTYLPSGEVSQITLDDETGHQTVTQLFYDTALRLNRINSRVNNPGTPQQTIGQIEIYEFDEAGNIKKETRGASGSSNLVIDKVFDAYNRIDTITQGGVTEDYNYNPNGTLGSKIDGNQNTTNNSYDALKRLTTTEQIGQVITVFSYDTHGNNLTVTDPKGQTTTSLYDDLGNRVELDSPDTGVTNYAFNSAGQVISQTDAMLQLATTTYDALGRAISNDRPGTDHDVTYSYDVCTNGNGRLCSVSTGWGYSIAYGWNALGELASITTNDGTIGYTYGPKGALTSITYPSGRTVLFDLDGGGIPVDIRLQYGALNPVAILSDIQYSPLQKPVQWTFGNGTEVTTSLDSRHRTTSIDADGLWSWQGSSYDGNDNLLTRSNPDDSYTYDYDDLDRLTGATATANSYSFSYDDVGNRLTKTVNGQPESASYETGSNRIDAFGDVLYVLDPNGNTVEANSSSSQSFDFVYSPNNRLIELIDPDTSNTLASYQYDALGQRVSKFTSTEVRKFMYGPNGELLVVMDGSGTILHEYVYLAGQPVVDLGEEPTGPPPTPPQEVLLDDTAATVWGSNWGTKSSSSAIGGTYRENRKRPGRAVEWRLTDPNFVSGSYDTYIRWMEPAGSGSQTGYDISFDGGSTTVYINHTQHSFGDWVFVGNFNFETQSGSYNGITLRGDNNTFGYEGTFIEADAVKFVPTFAPEDTFNLRYIVGDNLGTPQVVLDDSGTIVWKATYEPFGKAVVDEDPDGDSETYSLNIRFPGQYYDAESGLHYNYFRDYDPSLGRYVESDPIGLFGGINTFNYASSNPIAWTDLKGLCDNSCFLSSAGINLNPDQVWQCVLAACAAGSVHTAENGLVTLASSAQYACTTCTGRCSLKFLIGLDSEIPGVPGGYLGGTAANQAVKKALDEFLRETARTTVKAVAGRLLLPLTIAAAFEFADCEYRCFVN